MLFSLRSTVSLRSAIRLSARASLSTSSLLPSSLCISSRAHIPRSSTQLARRTISSSTSAPTPQAALAAKPRTLEQKPAFDVQLTTLGEVYVTPSGSSKPVQLHNLWLRDHCRCPACFHEITKQRLFDTFQLDSVPVRTEAGKEGLHVTWNDRHASPEVQTHESFYPWSFLGLAPDASRSQTLSRPPTPSISSELTQTPLGKVYWTSDIARAPPTVQYDAVMNDERAVMEWLENVHTYGFCLVRGVPPTPEDTQKLIERIAFIRITHYDGFWDFTADMAHGDTAYTNLALKAHTDSTYFTDPCGLQIFHLLSHTEGSGGESLLVDGFRAAAQLGRESPKHLRTLSQTKVATHAVGDEKYHFVIPQERGNRIVELGQGESDEPVRIAWNNDDRGTMRGMSVSELDEWYAALTHWDKLLSSPESEYWFQLEPGTVVVIDNHRVLHGRAAFTGKRRMCGAYIGADDYLARLRALRHREAARDGSEGRGDSLTWRV